MTDTYADSEERKKRKGSPYGFSPYWSQSSSTPNNEPAGFTLIPNTDLDFSLPIANLTTDAKGWRTQWDVTNGVSQVVTGSTPPFAMQKFYAAGFTGGVGAGNFFPSGAPVTASLPTPNNVATRLYVRITCNLSANFQGHSGGTNKPFLFIQTERSGGLGLGNPLFIRPSGAGSNALDCGFGIQTTLDTRNLTANTGAAGARIFTRGVNHLLEFVLQQNTAANLDGAISWWLDGVLIGVYTNLGISESTTVKRWSIALADVWGGGGDTVTNDMSAQMLSLYMSTGP